MNHSGGTSIPDVWGLILAWYAHFGTQRPLHPLAHEMVLGTPLTARYFERRGVLAADRHVAAQALRAGHDVLVLPGGDLEAWRPYRDRFRVDFGGRTGYATLAAEAQVPIVPVAHVGAHETLVVLARGRRLARALRLPELTRAEIFPIHLSMPWGLAIGPLPHIPWPGTLRYRVGRPIPPGAPPSPSWSEADRARHTAAIDIQVRIAIQTELDRFKAQLAKHPA
jgi:1-acyl-sn-glycerol-3-phosphate acyltransferase